MDSPLSQDEVDALLKGMRDGEVPLEETPAADDDLRPYNLVAEERSVSRQFPGLEIVHDRLVRHLRQSFSALVGTSVGVEIQAAEMLRYARFRNRIESGSPLSLFSILPLHGNGLIAMSPALVFQLVDRVFGGKGALGEVTEARDWSPIELQVVARVASLILSALEHAWSTVSPLECNYLRTEMNPAVVSTAASEDVVFVIELSCDFGSGPARFTMELPMGILEPVRNAIGETRSTAPAVDRAWIQSLTEAVLDAEVDVSVELGRRLLSAGDLLQLEVGYLLTLPTRVDDLVSICVEGETVLRGVAGTNRGQHAVRVVGTNEGDIHA